MDILLDTNAVRLGAAGGRPVEADRSGSHNGGGRRVPQSDLDLRDHAEKVRVGKWPAMAPVASNLAAYASLQGVAMAPLDAAICAAAGSMAWGHKDPFDRMIAATALRLGCPLVSSDAAFDGVVPRLW